MFHLEDILESIPETHFGLLPLGSFDGIDLTRNLISSISLNISIDQDMKSFHPYRAREKRLKPVNSFLKIHFIDFHKEGTYGKNILTEGVVDLMSCQRRPLQSNDEISILTCQETIK